MSLLRILAVIAAALAVLSRCHLTLWVAGHAMATVPALQAVGLFAALFAAAFSLVLWRWRHPRSYWRTA